MHPDDELKKRLRERFANYKPDPETSWKQLEERLLIPAKPFRRNARVVAAVVLVLIMTASAGFWIIRKHLSRNVETSSRAKEAFSKSLLVGSNPRRRGIQKLLSTGNLSKSAKVHVLQRVAVDLAETKHLQKAYIPAIGQVPKTTNLRRGISKILSGISASESILGHRPSGRMRITYRPATSNGGNASFLEQDILKIKYLLSTDSSLLSADLPEGIIGDSQALNARHITPLSVGLLSPHLPIPPIGKKYITIEPSREQGVWLLKGGPLLSYSVMNSKFREANGAVHLENLRTSLPERLGWNLYIGRQHPLSRGRQLEVGVVLRQFGQGIRYQVPNGEHSVVVQPDRSLIVTQLSDTLSERSTARQAGLRLGYRAPISLSSGLYWGIGGEVIYQLNLGHTVVNAEVTIGKTLVRTRSSSLLIELFANTAIKPVYDSNTWVRVLPYHFGLRIGMPLGIGQ